MMEHKADMKIIEIQKYKKLIMSERKTDTRNSKQNTTTHW